MNVLIPILLALLPLVADAARLQHERVYQEAWCSERGGAAEVVLRDRTRVDCVTPDRYAV